MFSDVLFNGIQSVIRQFKQIDLTEKHAFLNNLVFMFHTMKASENLLMVAIGQCEEGSQLHQYFSEHLKEERSHEKWVEEDLNAVGIDVKQTTVNREAVEMAGSQYYLIYHVNPAALLGYMAVLECFPMALEHVEKLEEIHGKAVVRTLRYHATHDIDHGKDLLALIDRLEVKDQNLIFQNAIQTAHYLGCAVEKFG